MEKQIEEMGASGYSKFAWKLWSETKLPMTQCLQIEQIVQEQGYRKQIEGEWRKDKNARTCSECGFQYWARAGFFGYCPNCGAKMKGANE